MVGKELEIRKPLLVVSVEVFPMAAVDTMEDVERTEVRVSNSVVAVPTMTTEVLEGAGEGDPGVSEGVLAEELIGVVTEGLSILTSEVLGGGGGGGDSVVSEAAPAEVNEGLKGRVNVDCVEKD